MVVEEPVCGVRERYMGLADGLVVELGKAWSRMGARLHRTNGGACDRLKIRSGETPGVESGERREMKRVSKSNECGCKASN
jgi:hypothetical protein